MEPEILSSVVAAGAGALGLIGARRQAAHPDEPTVGRQVAAAGGVVANGLSSAIRTTGVVTTGLVSGIGEVGAAVGAATLRVAGQVSSGAVAAAVGAVTASTATSAGLMVDGVTSVVEALTTPLRSSEENVAPLTEPTPLSAAKRPARRRTATT